MVRGCATVAEERRKALLLEYGRLCKVYRKYRRMSDKHLACSTISSGNSRHGRSGDYLQSCAAAGTREDRFTRPKTRSERSIPRGGRGKSKRPTAS